MIGKRLNELRRKRKMTQKDLAAILGVQKTAVSLYETNRNDPSDKIKVDIAKYFDVSLDYLLGVIDECVPYYSKNRFLLLPPEMTDEENMLLSQFCSFIEFRR